MSSKANFAGWPASSFDTDTMDAPAAVDARLGASLTTRDRFLPAATEKSSIVCVPKPGACTVRGYVPATARTVAPPVEPVRTSGLTRASKTPRMTLAPLIGSPVVALTKVRATVPFRAAVGWSNPGCGSASSPVAETAEAPAPRRANTDQMRSASSPW